MYIYIYNPYEISACLLVTFLHQKSHRLNQRLPSDLPKRIGAHRILSIQRFQFFLQALQLQILNPFRCPFRSETRTRDG